MILGAMIHHYDNERTRLFWAHDLNELNKKVSSWCAYMDANCCVKKTDSEMIGEFVRLSHGDWMYFVQEGS